jgi:fucose 4-O-acetylase-like acetyltransferase
MNNNNSRIEFIDLAKGICIILVVIFHLSGSFEDNPYRVLKIAKFQQTFRMPLYFFLSGLFFKSYSNFFDFTIRKINKLLIPFLFFLLTTSLLLPLFFDKIGLNSYYANDFRCFQNIWHSSVFVNYPIWFLLGLFEANIIFYLLHLIASQISKYILIISLFLIGISSFYVDPEFPFYFKRVLYFLPFFGIGYLVKQSKYILYPNDKDKYLPFVILGLGIITWILTDYTTLLPFKLIAYICGITGTLFIISLSKMIKHLPGISYYGRYSIMILCTHTQIMKIILKVVCKIFENIWICEFITFVITMLSYFVIIPLFIKYLPYVTAQKDLLQYSSLKNYFNKHE